MLIEILLVVFSMIAMGSLFFLIYITWTINEQLQDDDDVINKLQDEIDELKQMAKWNREQWLDVKKNKDELIEYLESTENSLRSRVIKYLSDIDKKNDEIDRLEDIIGRK